MKGVVLDFNEDTSRGVIAAEDGCRYEFAGINWLSERYPGSGMHVDFEASEKTAENIYLDPCYVRHPEKERITAALLAFFFGWLGVHKFYLGHRQPAAIMLCVSLGGLLLFAIPTLIMMMVGFIEFIIYVTSSDENFDRVYIHGDRDWF